VPYRVLVVAPSNPDLLMLSDEVMQVVNTLGARLLQGARANVHGLLDILREGWDIVWFASHGDERGIYLSDGVITASEITSLIRSAGVVLTVFNTCSSYEVAHKIFGELKTTFVCTVKPVPDRVAYVTGVLFAQKIADGLDFQSAYEAAKPGQNSTYTFLGAKGQVMSPPAFDKARSEGDSTSRLQEIVEQLDAIVNGSSRYHIVGLVKSNESLGAKMEALTAEVAQLRENQKLNRRLLVTLSVICFLLLVAVIALAYMQGGGA
jgi:hypothetical protein